MTLIQRTLIVLAAACFPITVIRSQCGADVQHLLNARKFAGARAQLDARLARNDKDDGLLDCRGRVELEAGKRKMRLHAAEILKVNAVRGHMGYGRIAEQEKDYATAEKEFLLGITARPDSEVAYSAAGGFYRRRERWAKAIAMYRKQLAAMPKDPSLTRLSNAHYSLALSLQGSGRPDLAKPEFQAAVAANPDNANASKALASLP